MTYWILLFTKAFIVVPGDALEQQEVPLLANCASYGSCFLSVMWLRPQIWTLLKFIAESKKSNNV